MAENTVKQRDYAFDFIKGILIFLVVLGHTIQMSGEGDFTQNPINAWIYSFHMPMFFFIAGYFSKRAINCSFYDCFSNKAKRLLMPALIWTSIAVCYKILIEKQGFNIRTIMQSIHNIWFLYCLFGITLFANVVWKTKYPKTISFLIAIFLIIIYPFNNIPLFKALQFTRQWPEFVLGLLFLPQINIANYMNNKDKAFWYRILFFTIFSIIYICWFIKAGIEHNPFYVFSSENYILRIIVQLLSTVVFFNLFYTMYHYCKLGFLTKLGGVSMGVYLIHPYILSALLTIGIDINALSLMMFSITATLVSVALYKSTRKIKFIFGE